MQVRILDVMELVLEKQWATIAQEPIQQFAWFIVAMEFSSEQNNAMMRIASNTMGASIAWMK